VLAVALLACGRGEGHLVKQVATVRSAPLPEAEPVPAPERDYLVWTGCDISMNAYVSEAAEEYTRRSGVEVVITGGGATRGIRATVGGMSDIGGTCRHALCEEFPEEEGGALLTHVAWDALVFMTHRSNPVDGISLEQARGILLGRIRNWKELGGPDQAILPVFRRQTTGGKLSGVGYMTRLLLFGDSSVDYTSNALFFASSAPVEEYVEKTPHSFAVTGISSARKRDAKVLSLEGVVPDKASIASGAYPLFRPLYLATDGEPQGRAADFLDWILSEEGQAILSRAGTVNLAEGQDLAARFLHWPEQGVRR